MCKNCYELYIDRAEMNMLACEFKKDETDIMLKLCTCQRYCSDKKQYIPFNQEMNCKSYE